MTAWVTSVTGSWRGEGGKQLQAAPWREQQSLEKEHQRSPWRAGLGRQEHWPGPSSCSQAALSSIPSNEQAEEL